MLKRIKRRFLKEHKEKFYFSQKGQEKFLLEYIFQFKKLGFKRDGYFIDLACADGVNLSNTFTLEKFLGWNGILIDANPKYEKAILKNRKSKYVQACVTNKSDDIINFRVDNGMLSGIVGDEYDNNTKVRGNELKNAEILELRTKTLTSILDDNAAPKIIDFMSLDIEGAEMTAILGLDFAKYNITTLCIEAPNLDLCLYLDEFGYR